MVSVAVPGSALSAMMAARRLPLPAPPSAKVIGVMEDRTVRSSRDSRSRKWTADRRLARCRPRQSRAGRNLLDHIGCDCGSNIGATPFLISHVVKNTSREGHASKPTPSRTPGLHSATSSGPESSSRRPQKAGIGSTIRKGYSCSNLGGTLKAWTLAAAGVSPSRKSLRSARRGRGVLRAQCPGGRVPGDWVRAWSPLRPYCWITGRDVKQIMFYPQTPPQGPKIPPR